MAKGTKTKTHSAARKQKGSKSLADRNDPDRTYDTIKRFGINGTQSSVADGMKVVQTMKDRKKKAVHVKSKNKKK